MDTILNDLINEATTAEAAVKTAQAAYAGKLTDIVTHLKGSTFEHEGKWFQIRTRKQADTGEQITYLCALKAAPSTWLKGRPKGSVNKKKAASLDSATPSDPVMMLSAAFNAAEGSETAEEVNSDTVIE